MECALHIGHWTWSLSAFSSSFSWTAPFPVAGRGSRCRSFCRPGVVWGIALVSAWAGCGLVPVRSCEELELPASSTWIVVSDVSGLGPLHFALDPWRHPQERMYTLFLPHLISADSGSVTHSHLRSGDPWLHWHQVSGLPLLRIVLPVFEPELVTAQATFWNRSREPTEPARPDLTVL